LVYWQCDYNCLDSISNGNRSETSPSQKRVLLLKPRGFCAGVVRAIDIVKIALETFGAPIYVRREIVHNRYVVNELAEKGAIFVHEIDDVPDGQRVIYSAHGVSPAVREISKGRHLKVIDATCPLVTKVHIEAVKFAKQGYSLVLIGHRDHDEIEGTLGEAPEATQVVSNVAEVAALQVPDPNRVAYLTQTTLSLDEARDIIHALKEKFPTSSAPTRRTSATPRRTARSRSATWRTMPNWCWWWAQPTAPTPTAWSRSRATWGPSAT
jgi:4-hydroxy-3-methylbut-2-enyl diphosphate reductase